MSTRALPSLLVLLLLQCLAPGPTHAHFVLNHPPALGFNADSQGSAPCGGFAYDDADARDFHVAGDYVSYRLLHTQASLIVRGTLDTDLASDGTNWTVLYPTYTQYGLGSFCVGGVMAPPAWAGNIGTVQVIENAEDGNVFACSVVYFVNGSLTDRPNDCSNSSGTSGSFATNAELSTFDTGSRSASANRTSGSAGGGGGDGTTASSSSSSPSASRESGADGMVDWRGTSMLGSLAVLGAMAVGFAL